MRKGKTELVCDAGEEEEEERNAAATCFQVLQVDGNAHTANRYRFLIFCTFSLYLKKYLCNQFLVT